MCRVVDEPPAEKTDAEIQQDHRQQARAKYALETFGQFAPVLQAENKQYADQSEQSTGRARRRDLVSGLDQEASDQTRMRAGNHRQVTCQHAANAGRNPEHDKLGRAVKLLDPRADHPKAVHVNEHVRQIDVNKNRRNEAPKLMIVMDRIIGLGAVGEKHPFINPGPQNRRLHPARFPHQHEDEKIRDQKNDAEDVRAREHGTREANRIALVQWQPGWRSLLKRRAANMATVFSGANQRAAVATKARTPSVVWMIRQAFGVDGLTIYLSSSSSRFTKS